MKALLTTAVFLSLMGFQPSFGFSMDFLKRGGMHCLEGKDACTKHPNLCTNRLIFNMCTKECLIKRRQDAKTPSIKKKLLECDEDFIKQSQYAGSLLSDKGTSHSHHHMAAEPQDDDEMSASDENFTAHQKQKEREKEERARKRDEMRKKYGLDKR